MKVQLCAETDWDGWRAATRSLILDGIPPEQIKWSVDPKHPHLPPETSGSFGLARALVSLASQAIQARDPERFALLYRLVWRAQAGENLVEDQADPDMRRTRGLALAVRAEQHRMRNQIRYLRVDDRYVGWYVPAHFVVEANTLLLARRFADYAVAILTPDASAFWDPGTPPRFGAGVSAEAIPDDDALTEWYRSYGDEMEAAARPGTSIPEAERLGDDPWPPDRQAIGPVVMPVGIDSGIAAAIRESADCRRCDLWKYPTQTVFGEGPAGARVMFVGEVPGDQEDIVGRPFVGPAGQLLDRAMEEAGIDRRAAYVTNAVKHFKFTPRGKRRLHQTPDGPEIQACRFWLDVERVRLAPSLIVALGATAARTVLGRAVTIGRERGRPIRLSDTETAFVTVHPSFLLRVPDEDAKRREYRAFVQDMKTIAKLIGA
jgi:probable DNA metabolism protein